MANKITKDSVHAFIAGRPFNRENMSVDISTNYVSLRLHGNAIAIRDRETGGIFITNCGWFSNTTKMRLNYLLHIFNSSLKITQKNWVWYLGNDQWNGNLVYIYGPDTTTN